jgi:hypothetical protein
MAGMFGKQGLVDFALGYDDDAGQSTETQRGVYFFHFSGFKAHPGFMLQLRSVKPVIRPPANEGEHIVAKIVEATLKRMMRP